MDSRFHGIYGNVIKLARRATEAEWRGGPGVPVVFSSESLPIGDEFTVDVIDGGRGVSFR